MPALGIESSVAGVGLLGVEDGLRNSKSSTPNEEWYVKITIMKKLFYSLILIFSLLISTGARAADEIDSDSDGLTDVQEINIYKTDPQNADTDGDGYKDGQEVANGYSPKHGDRKKLTEVDSDKDYLPDAWEIALDTDLTNPDSDGDKFLDGTEVRAGYDPLNPEKIKLEKLITVDLKKQRLAYYFGSKKLENFLISSGVKGWETPQGEFAIIKKYPVKHYTGIGFDFPNTKWNLHFTTKKFNFYIHGTYWHNDFGKPKSHGCVNVSYQNMEHLYDWTQVGTKVIITD
ncbi:MAG: L,D-transpeptidase family protein [Patescibacteria group bacterium]